MEKSPHSVHWSLVVFMVVVGLVLVSEGNGDGAEKARVGGVGGGNAMPVARRRRAGGMAYSVR